MAKMKQIQTFDASDMLDIEYSHLNLELGEVDFTKLRNPFLNYKTIEDYEQILRIIRDPKNFDWTCKHILNIEPGVFQLVWLDHLWRYPYPMLIANRGASKTFTTALYYVLRALITQGAKIVIASASFRQAKLVFDYIETIWNGAPVLRDICGSDSGAKHGTDKWDFRLGASLISAVPLGTGEKIRGMRANYVDIEEFGSVNEEIFEVVLRGFTATASNPIENIKTISKIKKIKAKGLEENLGGIVNLAKPNQIILSGTADWDFKHFAKYWRKYKSIINSRGETEKLREIFGGDPEVGLDWKDYCIIRVPIELLPEGMMEPKAIANAKATMDKGRYEMEYGACFSKDSNGFFRRTLIESCVTKHPVILPSGPVQFYPMLKGNPHNRYTMGVDPASESDNFCVYIVEVWPDHQRAVYCWTTNREKHYNRFQKKAVADNNFYSYCARKIRILLDYFPCEVVSMDSQGGGIQVMECLHDLRKLENGELPIWPIRMDNPLCFPNSKDWGYDDEAGLHMLEMINFSKADYVVEANHGMRKDLENKTLLFPHIDSLSLTMAELEDQQSDNLYDNMQDLILEIEESKEELSSIMHTTTLNGRDQWQTPELVLPGNKRGRMRKDRYSALLMANMSARRIHRQSTVVYGGSSGGFISEFKNVKIDGKLYNGPDWFISGANKSKQLGAFQGNDASARISMQSRY